MTSMRLADKAVVHQVHPVKIGADITASVISNALFWKGRPKSAITVRALLPVTGSLAVLSLADLDALAASRRGRYVLAHMPPSAQAVRLAGDALMGLGAHRRSAALLIAGAIVIAAGWSHPAWPTNHRRPLPRPSGWPSPTARTTPAGSLRRSGLRPGSGGWLRHWR
jgi:hypothetical protein